MKNVLLPSNFAHCQPNFQKYFRVS